MLSRAKRNTHGDVAQLGEHYVRNVGVVGSNPIISTMEMQGLLVIRQPFSFPRHFGDVGLSIRPGRNRRHVDSGDVALSVRIDGNRRESGFDGVGATRKRSLLLSVGLRSGLI